MTATPTTLMAGLQISRRPRTPTLETVNLIVDGDTLYTREHPTAIRIEGYNTPERGQLGYERAKQALEHLLPPGKQIRVEFRGKDVYGRDVCRVCYWTGSYWRDVAEYMKPYAK